MKKLNGTKRVLTTTLALILIAAVVFTFCLNDAHTTAYAAPETQDVATEEESIQEEITEDTEEETVSADPADVLATATTDQVAAAEMLTTIEEQSEYETTLRAILNDYYGNGESAETIQNFTDGLDERADVITNHYANAAKERANGSTEYQAGTVLVLADSQSAVEAAMGANMGTISDVTSLDGQVMVTIHTSLEYSVADASTELANASGIEAAQPNFFYHLSEGEELEAVAEEDIANETTVDEEVTSDEEITDEAIADTENEVVDEQVTEETTTEEVVEEEKTEDDEAKEEEKKIEGANDAKLGSQTFLKVVDAFGAWDILPKTGNKVVVGVIDTGVRASHEDLQGMVKGATTDNSTSHGTHVCGIIAAKANNGKGGAGVASGYSAKRGKGNDVVQLSVANPALNTSEIAKQIENLSNSGAKVINMSVGGPGSDPVIDKAIKNAFLNKKTLCISAAGNEGTNRVASPSDSSFGISVINVNNNGSKYSSSNYGVEKDIAAPGVQVLSTVATADNAYGSKTGTSMATPVVSGVAAMVYFTNSGLSARDVKNILYGSGSNGSYNTTTGFGMINAKKAVQAANSRTSTVSAVQFNTTKKTMYVGDTYTMEYRVLPVNTSSTKLSWSSNSNAATVDANGTITAKSAGTATITGTVGGKSASVTVTVKERYTKVNQTSFTETKSTTIESPISSEQAGASYMNGYVLTVKKGQTLTVKATSGTLDTFVRIYDANRNPILSNDDGRGTNALLSYTSGRDQTIYVEVTESMNSVSRATSGVVGLGSITTSIEVADGTSKKLASEGTTTLKTTAKASSNTYNAISLSWTKLTGASGYRIYRKNGTKWDLIKTYGHPGNTSIVDKSNQYTTFTDTGRTFGVNYTYKVVPFVNVDGKAVAGADSAAVATTTKLAAPKVTAAKASYNSVKVTWNQITGANGYYIYRNGKLVKTITSATTKTFTDTGLATGTKYTYQVAPYRTVSGKKVAGTKSAAAAATPTLNNAKITKLVRGPKYIKVTWSKVAGASGYTVYRSTSLNGKYTAVGTITNGNTTTFKNGNLKSGGHYYYYVKAYRQVGSKKVYGGFANKANTTAK